jgi:hypothetical protein
MRSTSSSSTPEATPRTPAGTAADALWRMSGIEALSADLLARVRSHLVALCSDARAHARFLNMLSLMEHIGSRKIMVSQSRGALGCEVLKHLSEEARHAFYFKRQAERIAGRQMAYEASDTLVPGAARMYFGRLDAGINRALPAEAHAEVPYLYVSMIIELRAIWAYTLYHEVLVEQETGMSLKSVLAEEELHLPQMADRLAALGEDLDDRVPVFARLEDRLFRGLWQAVEGELRYQ